MEFIESVAWIGLGFVPTLLSLEIFSRRYARSKSTGKAPRFGMVRPEVKA